MENIKLIRKKIPHEEKRYYKPTDTHLITVSCEDDGNVFQTGIYPIAPNELKEVYQRCLSDLVIEIQSFKINTQFSKKPSSSWNNIELRVNGLKIEGIKSVDYNELANLAKLESDLLIAEQNEEYELCAKLKKQIDQLKSKS